MLVAVINICCSFWMLMGVLPGKLLPVMFYCRVEITEESLYT